jgi:flagellar assembly protein FliH
LLELALAVAREIIGREVTLDPALVEGALGDAVGQVNEATRLVARVNPDDLAYLQEQGVHLSGGREGAALTLMGDETIDRGGCRLETDRGNIDATLQTQMLLVRETLTLGAWEDPSGAEL